MISTSLSGRLRNTHLPKSHGLFPLFEAVVNSIQSIDSMYGDDDGGRITVRIIRDGQFGLELPTVRDSLEPITGFQIHDNGAGFNDANMASFETLDSEYKLNQGCRGVGRLLWLKAFGRVEVRSVFKEAGQFKRRQFRFTPQEGISAYEVEEVEDCATFAEVSLTNFNRTYQRNSRKKASTIARDLLEHCLWYFVRDGGAPDIYLIDDQESINLQQTYEEYMRSSAKSVRIKVKEVKFDLIHLKLKTNSRATPHLNWCAANRVVIEETLTGKVPGLHGPLVDDEGEFVYAGYLTSDFLNERVRSERTDFDLDENADEFGVLIAGDEPASKAEIRDAVLREVQAYLEDSLTAARDKGRGRVEQFVSQKAPRYRPILRRIDEQGTSIDPGLSDKDLELELHKHLTDLEAEVLQEGQEVLGDSALHLQGDGYSEKLANYLAKVEDIKKSDLAAYVSRRRVILELLRQAIEIAPDGKYSRESRVHELIVPMRTTSGDAPYKANNLWIVDERLSFHDYLASDKSLASMPIVESSSTKEPDVLALQTFDSPVLVAEGTSPGWASLSIIELKRPMRDDASEGDKNPIEQCLDYLRRVRDGKVRTASGRPIPNAENIPAFCYILADLTPTMVTRCLMASLKQTADGLGYFGYNDNYKAYIEVLSFDGLLLGANQRNRAFFDIVGLPIE